MTVVESVTLLAVVAGLAVCQVKTMPEGLLVAVMVLIFTVVLGQLFVSVSTLNTGAALPADERPLSIGL